MTLTSVTAFDQHRRDGKCLTPDEAGLIRSGREYESYGNPIDDEARDRLKAAREAAADAAREEKS